MKIIDLLNRIAKDEGIPIKIKFKGKEYEWSQEFYDYRCIDINHKYLVEDLETEDLNRTCEEIPLIEEDRKDEEIEIYVNGEKIELFDYEPLKQGEFFYKENGKWYVHKLKNVSKIIEEDKKIEPLVLQNFTSNQKKIARKVNEIIDYLNKEA